MEDESTTPEPAADASIAEAVSLSKAAEGGFRSETAETLSAAYVKVRDENAKYRVRRNAPTN